MEKNVWFTKFNFYVELSKSLFACLFIVILPGAMLCGIFQKVSRKHDPRQFENNYCVCVIFAFYNTLRLPCCFSASSTIHKSVMKFILIITISLHVCQ